MTSNPDDIRRDIERTRADLSHNVNALADQANPANIARRQVDRVTGGARDLKTRIFGDPHDPWDDGAVGDVQHRAAGGVDLGQFLDQHALDGRFFHAFAYRAHGKPLCAALAL